MEGGQRRIFKQAVDDWSFVIHCNMIAQFLMNRSLLGFLICLMSQIVCWTFCLQLKFRYALYTVATQSLLLIGRRLFTMPTIITESTVPSILITDFIGFQPQGLRNGTISAELWMIMLLVLMQCHLCVLLILSSKKWWAGQQQQQRRWRQQQQAHEEQPPGVAKSRHSPSPSVIQTASSSSPLPIHSPPLAPLHPHSDPLIPLTADNRLSRRHHASQTQSQQLSAVIDMNGLESSTGTITTKTTLTTTAAAAWSEENQSFDIQWDDLRQMWSLRS